MINKRDLEIIEILENNGRESFTEIARKAASMVVGPENVVNQRHPSLGGEDFAYYLQKLPGCLVRFGAGQPELANIPAHSPYFDFDEGVLPIGAAYLAQVALQALQEKNILMSMPASDPISMF